MNNYLQLLKQVRQNGTYKEDRTGTGTYSQFGAQLRFHLQDGFPAVTTKKLFFKSVVTELLWFLRGESNIAFLKENNCGIWDAWADENEKMPLRVNLFDPGATRTGMRAEAMPSEDPMTLPPPEEVVQQLAPLLEEGETRTGQRISFK